MNSACVRVPPERRAAWTPRAADAFAELELVVRGLGDELAFFRRRALDAERRVRELLPSTKQSVGAEAGLVDVGALQSRVARLEAENAELRERLAEAAERTRAVAERMRFARQQQESDGER